MMILLSILLLAVSVDCLIVRDKSQAEFLLTADKNFPTEDIDLLQVTRKQQGDGEVNAIMIENSQKGNPSTEWEINGSGDPSIQGFAHPFSVDQGHRVDFRVRVEKGAKFKIDIYRLGYYQGHGARKIESFKAPEVWSGVQPACLRNETTGLTDCLRWRVNLQWKVSSNAVSGVYFAKFTRVDWRQPATWRADNSQVGEDARFQTPGKPFAKPQAAPHSYGASGHGKLRRPLEEPRASHAYFVVRADKTPKADILFQTSDTTWQAYNDWTEDPAKYASTYGSYPGQPDKWNPRIYECSYNRPLRTRQNRPINAVFGAEFPAIQFLERNGFSVTYWSGRDTHKSSPQGVADRAKVFLSVGHDEYWSGPQRHNVESARDLLGLHFVSLAGNQVFWRVRHVKDTMVVYKETQSLTKIDPEQSEWTGTFRDGREINPLGANPENSLSGLIFTVNAWRLDPLVVPYQYTSLRWWNNTELQETVAPGQVGVLARGLLGHEFDEDLDNGSRPANMLRLSETHVDNVMYAQDAGSTYDSGSAVHRLVLFKHPASGAITFGAGSVQFSWGLAPIHDDVGGVNLLNNFLNSRIAYDLTTVEQSVQQLMVNIFAVQGVRGSLLQAGLTQPCDAVDSAPPRSSVVSASAMSVLVTASDSGGGVVAAVEVSLDSGLTWHPAITDERRSASDTVWLYLGAVPNPDKVLSRATDDSFNVEVVATNEEKKSAKEEL